MIIKFFTTYSSSEKELLVKITISDEKHNELFEKIINLQNQHNIIEVEFDLLKFSSQDIIAKFSTANLNISNHPLIIDNILLDDFYSHKKITHSAKQQFDEEFLSHAEKNNISINHTSDNNCLSFTGSLVYKFLWPFVKNIQI